MGWGGGWSADQLYRFFSLVFLYLPEHFTKVQGVRGFGDQTTFLTGVYCKWFSWDTILRSFSDRSQPCQKHFTNGSWVSDLACGKDLKIKCQRLHTDSRAQSWKRIFLSWPSRLAFCAYLMARRKLPRESGSNVICSLHTLDHWYLWHGSSQIIFQKDSWLVCSTQ